jgi:hypothetical protein
MRFLEEAAFSLEESSVRVRSELKAKTLCHTYTDRFRSSLIALISIFLRPILAFGAHVTFEPVDGTDLAGVMDSRPAFGLRVAEVGKRNKEYETSACEQNVSGRLLVKVRRLFQ